MLDPNGLPKREWYRHLLYAPGFYTGYAVKTMPEVREGIEQKDYDKVAPEVQKLALALRREIEMINAAGRIWKEWAPQSDTTWARSFTR